MYIAVDIHICSIVLQLLLCMHCCLCVYWSVGTCTAVAATRGACIAAPEKDSTGFSRHTRFADGSSTQVPSLTLSSTSAVSSESSSTFDVHRSCFIADMVGADDHGRCRHKLGSSRHVGASRAG